MALEGIPAFSVSLRGHGKSTQLSTFHKITLSTSDLCIDLKNTIDWVHNQYITLGYPILLGHSAGGGLSQLLLSKNNENIKVHGLILLASYPPWGGIEIYKNVWKS